jgi:sugar lactone lactonase YvrE
LLASVVSAQTATNDLYAASFMTGRLTRIDGTTGTTVFDVALSTSVVGVVRPGNGALYVSTHAASTVLQVDPETGANLGVFASGGGLMTATGLAFGPDGNLYVGSQGNSSVVRYDGSTGTFIDTFVPSGSGGLTSTEELLFGPDGNLYVTEFSGSRVLRYDGITGAFLDVFATDPTLSWTRAMVFGPDGNLYVAGNLSGNVVRFDGVSGASLGVFASGISGANGLAFGPDGNLYVAAEFGQQIMKFDGVTGAFIGVFASPTGPIGLLFDVRLIATVAGGGTPSPSFCGDGGPATSACLFFPIGLAVDANDNLFIGDDFNNRVRRVDAVTGNISTVAGSASVGFCGDGGPATSACLNQVVGIATDANGNLFITDYGNNRIRRVDAVTGIISTVAGSANAGFCGDGGPATTACLSGPVGVKVDANGNLFIADYNNNRIRRVDAVTSIISTVAGSASAGFCGDGGPATAACLNSPAGLTLDSNGNVFVADRFNHRVRRVDAITGMITTVGGNGTPGFCGDGGPAGSACLNAPSDLAVDGAGNLSIADRGNHRIRRVNGAGIISTVAGGGAPSPGFCGDGGAASRACLFNPTGVAFDPVSGGLLVGDTDNHRVRVVP